MTVNHTFEFYIHPDRKSYSVVQIHHWGKRNPYDTFIGKTIARWIPVKFVQRYIDKLLSLGYTKDPMSNDDLIILTSEAV